MMLIAMGSILFFNWSNEKVLLVAEIGSKTWIKKGVYYDFDNKNSYLQCNIRVLLENLSKVIEH